MATPLRFLRHLRIVADRSLTHKRTKYFNVSSNIAKRHLLSSSYNCYEAWNKYLNDSSSLEVSFLHGASRVDSQVVSFLFAFFVLVLVLELETSNKWECLLLFYLQHLLRIKCIIYNTPRLFSI